MDEFVVYKMYDLSSFKRSGEFDVFKKLIEDNMITFNDIIFTEHDFKVVDKLG